MRDQVPQPRCPGAALSAALALAAAPALAQTPPAAPAPPAPSPAPTPADLALLNRVAWGVSAASVADLQREGAEAWLHSQLHPAAGDHLPAAVQAEIQALALNRTPMALLVRDADGAGRFANTLPSPGLRLQAQTLYQQGLNELSREAQVRSLLRDIYSPDQLREQMTWFWFNHFNVQAGKANLRAMVGDYEDKAIRPHALGRFRDLLEATLKHPAMLRYLDNADNAAGHINENYARELMELHTMGVGSGYTQADVEALAHILTGVGIDLAQGDPHVAGPHAADLIHQGLFEFNPARHDYSDQTLLGHPIKGAGFAEVEQALDILCREPATAHHVSYELAEYFVSDTPPPALVDQMAATFQRTDGDIAAVLDTLFHAPAFRASLGTKFKDPIHYAVSAVRLAYGDRVIVNTQPIQNWLGQLAEGLYNHETPDGYAMTAAGWDAPGQMETRFEIARQIGAGPAALFAPYQPPAPPAPPAATPTAATPGSPPTTPPARPPPPATPQLQDAVFVRLSPATRAALAKATSKQDWNTLYLASPEFMRR